MGLVHIAALSVLFIVFFLPLRVLGQDSGVLCYHKSDCTKGWNKTSRSYETFGDHCCNQKCRFGECDPLPFDKWHIVISVLVVCLTSIIITYLSIHYCCRTVKKNQLPSDVRGMHIWGTLPNVVDMPVTRVQHREEASQDPDAPRRANSGGDSGSNGSPVIISRENSSVSSSLNNRNNNNSLRRPTAPLKGAGSYQNLFVNPDGDHEEVNDMDLGRGSESGSRGSSIQSRRVRFATGFSHDNNGLYIAENLRTTNVSHKADPARNAWSEDTATERSDSFE